MLTWKIFPIQIFNRFNDLVRDLTLSKLQAELISLHSWIPWVVTDLTEDWRLFIDSSKVGLKGELLHNGNRYLSIPIAHAIHMKEIYGNMQTLLEKIDYKKYAWNNCGDLK